MTIHMVMSSCRKEFYLKVIVFLSNRVCECRIQRMFRINSYCLERLLFIRVKARHSRSPAGRTQKKR